MVQSERLGTLACSLGACFSFQALVERGGHIIKLHSLKNGEESCCNAVKDLVGASTYCRYLYLCKQRDSSERKKREDCFNFYRRSKTHIIPTEK